MTRLQFTIPGKPMVLSRHRSGKYGMYNEKHVKEYQRYVAGLAKAAMREAGLSPILGAAFITCTFWFQRPKSHTKKQRIAPGAQYCTNRNLGDGSNLLKMIEDALNGVAYIDDSQLSDGCYKRRYTSRESFTSVLVVPAVPLNEVQE